MKVSRIIYPVGQGGMHYEHFSDGTNEFCILYDCGGSTKSIIEKRIDHLLHSVTGGHINAVFISHFHNDHINGLQYLLSKAKVDYLIIPQLTEELMAEAILYNSIHRSSHSANGFLVSLFAAENNLEDTIIIRIPPTDDPLYINDSITQLGQSSTIKSKKVFSPYFTTDWLFIPYNPIVPKIGFIGELKKILGVTDLNLTDLPRLLKANSAKLGEIKRLYEKKFNGKHNSYSMALYSGNKNGAVSRCYTPTPYLYHRSILDYSMPFRSANAAYTGDMEAASVQGMATYYGTLWETIGSIQVPHHGSFDNYTDLLYHFPVRGFISVGNNNSFHHPGISTLTGMERNYCQPVLVTEELSTVRTYCYEV